VTNGIADSTALRTISGFRSPSPSTLGSQVRLDVFENLFVEWSATHLLVTHLGLVIILEPLLELLRAHVVQGRVHAI